MRLGFWALLTLAGSVASPALATPVFVDNFSFEAPTLAQGTYQGDPNTNTSANTIPSWTSTGSAGVQHFSPTDYNQPTGTSPLTSPGDGLQAVYVNAGSIYQNVGPLVANTTYVLTVAAGNQPGYGANPASTGLIALATGVGGPFQPLASTNVFGQPVGAFADFTTSFSTSDVVSGDLYVVLSLSTNQQVDYDNVRLDATTQLLASADVPEPISLVLLAVPALAGMTLRRSRSIG